MTPTLVCVFLRGGADTLNLLVPHGDPTYWRARPTLAIPRPGAAGGAIDLDGFFGLHPSAAPLLPLWRDRRLAFVAAAGADDASGSHFEVQDRVEHGEAGAQRLGGGWLARALHASNGSGALRAVAVGERAQESLAGAPQVAVLRSLDALGLRVRGGAALATVTLRALYEAAGDRLTAAGRDTLDALAKVERLRGGAARDEDDFRAGLSDVARLVRADVGLEVACVDLPGWDTHFVQGTTKGPHAAMVERLARGLAAFDEELGALRDRVTVAVMTEFGRRTEENGSGGTDHGRGAAMMLIGPGVRGGRVHGAWPGLDADPGAGPGGLAVRVDYRDVLAEAARAVLGARAAAVFPGLAPAPLGAIA